MKLSLKWHDDNEKGFDLGAYFILSWSFLRKKKHGIIIFCLRVLRTIFYPILLADRIKERGKKQTLQ